MVFLRYHDQIQIYLIKIGIVPIIVCESMGLFYV